MGKFRQFLAKKFPKASLKYDDYMNKRESELPGRIMEKKRRLSEKIENIKGNSKLLRARNENINLRKQQLRSTLGFFSGNRTNRPIRKVKKRFAGRSRVIYIQQPNNYQPNQIVNEPPRKKMWFE